MNTVMIGDFLKSDGVNALYWGFAIAGSALFIIFACFQFLGFGGTDLPDDVDVDLDGNVDIPHADTGMFAFRMFSLHTILAFITMFGWGGVVWGEYGWIGFFGALACGLFTMVITAWVLWMIRKLQQSGTIRNTQLIGKTGKVYLTIPANKTKPGKVILNEGSSTREISAVCDEELPNGTEVVVIAADKTMFTVKRIEK